MEAIRQIIDLKKLGKIIKIPKYFNYSKVEIIIFPVEDSVCTPKDKFVPESFYGISNIADPENAILQMRDEWRDEWTKE
ncbi:MAG: hypothetical protein WC836_16460 [Desulfobacula sp.]|jgi:hypothetical protein